MSLGIAYEPRARNIICHPCAVDLMINETIYYTTRVDETHRVGGQLKFFERRPLNPTCVFKTQRERRRKKRNSLFPHSSEHSRISINSIGHLNKARRTFALRQKEQQYNKIASEKRSSGRV